MTPEAKVKKKVVEQLKELRAYYFYPVTGGYGLKQIRDAGGLDLVVNEDNMHTVRDELMECGKPAL